MKPFADMNNDNYYLVMPASGMGKRMKSETPKQYLKLSNGLTIIDQCLKTLLALFTRFFWSGKAQQVQLFR